MADFTINSLTTGVAADTNTILKSDTAGALTKITLAALKEYIIGNFDNIAKNDGAHNSIYRGANLGTSVTAEQYAAIKAGTFDNIFVGDYWVINGVVWRVAGLNYWYGFGDTACNTNHVVIVPDSNLSSGQMNTTNTTEGAYVNSDMYTGNNDNTALATAKESVINAFGNDHILSHRINLANTTLNGYESATTWFDSNIELMNEVMVYGTSFFHNSLASGVVPGNHIVDNSQLPLFRLNHKHICNRGNWWLRDVASATGFARVANAGNCSGYYASFMIGVRPAFGIYQA